MPRTKRTLVEADPNAEASIPKKSAKGKASSAQTTVTKWLDSEPSSNARKENDASDSNPKPPAAESATSKNAGSAAESPKYIVLGQPHWDRQAERYDTDENYDPDEDDGDEEGGRFVIYEAPNKDGPEWPWVVTEEGFKKYRRLEGGAVDRDQDAHGMYMYNDYSAYGVLEMVNNWLNDFNKEVSKKTISPYAVWAQLEGFALFSQSDCIGTWFQGDDCHGFCETITTIGKALLTGLHILKDHQLLKPYHPENGGFRNISTVLALFVQFVGLWTSIAGDHYGETKWVAMLADLAKENNIEMKGPWNFPDKHAQQLLNPDLAEKKSKKVRFSHGTWGTPYLVDADVEDEMDMKYPGDYSVKGWKKEFKDYSKGRRIGGSYYDLTKKSTAQKKKYKLGDSYSQFLDALES